MSEYSWQGAEKRRTKLLRKKEEREAHTREVQAVAESLGIPFEPPKSVADVGKHEERLIVPDGCMGLVIGKKGANLKAIEERLKVKIKLEKDSPVAVISGQSADDVAAAVRELDFAYETVELPPGTAGWTAGKKGKHLQSIRDICGLAALYMSRDDDYEKSKENDEDHRKEDEEDEEEEATDDANPNEAREARAAEAREAREAEARAAREARANKVAWLEMKGLRDRIPDARMCIEAHMSYFPVYKEMDDVERQLDRKLANAANMFGRRVGTARAGGKSGEVAAGDNNGDTVEDGDDTAKEDGEEATAAAPSQQGKGRGKGRGRGGDEGAANGAVTSTGRDVTEGGADGGASAAGRRGRGKGDKGRGRGRGKGGYGGVPDGGAIAAAERADRGDRGRGRGGGAAAVLAAYVEGGAGRGNGAGRR